MDEENKNDQKNPAFESLDVLISRWKDGTFSEIIDDWKWIFSYSARYKGAIAFYVILGIFSTSMGLVSSVASKYMIDIITGYETSKLWVMILIMVGSTIFSLAFSSIISRISTKLSIDINNDIQADIFDKIVDADWLSLNKYSNGDILNRFNGDIGTVSSNAISWLPTIIIALYNFVATFFVIMHYDWVMAVIALGSAPVMLLMSRFMIKKQRDYSKKVREMSSQLMTFEVEAFYNFDTIKSFWRGAPLQQENALVAEQVPGYQPEVQPVLHQDKYFPVNPRNSGPVHRIRILSVPSVDERYYIWNDDIVPAAEKQSFFCVQQCGLHYPGISEQLGFGAPDPGAG